jgi:UPF0755 protein
MKFRAITLAGLLFVLLVAASAGYLLNRTYAGFSNAVVVDVPKRTPTREIARLLRHNRVIRSEWAFLAARAIRPDSVLQAGEYKFDRPASVLEVYDRMVRGDVLRYEIRVPEGSNIFDIAAIVEQVGFLTRRQFLDVARDPSLIRDLAPQAPSLEGYLFPSTYFITRDTTAVEVCRRMTGQFRQVWNELKSAADVHTTITMASLVEKETAIPEERHVITSVFNNRLKLGLLLQCDPTTIYAALLAEAYRGAIYQSDLERKSAYNTYRTAGLPPGPIASPGRNAIIATLHPAETDYVYFVAKPDGSGAHVFSASLEEHNRAVALYRRGTRNEIRQNGAR